MESLHAGVFMVVQRFRSDLGLFVHLHGRPGPWVRRRACGAERDARGARSAGEQQGLTRRMGPRWSRRSSGAVEDSGDVVGVADDGEDAHPPAALAADGHVDGEHSSEQIGPAETARARGVATVRRAGAGEVEVEVEVEVELLPGRGDPRRREDASTKVVAICEHTEVPRRVNMRGRHEGAQAGEEPVRRHVGVGGPAAPAVVSRVKGKATTGYR